MYSFTLFLSLFIIGANCSDLQAVRKACLGTFKKCDEELTQSSLTSEQDRLFIHGAFSPLNTIELRHSSEMVKFRLKRRQQNGLVYAPVGELVLAITDSPTAFADKPSEFLDGKTWREVASDDKTSLFNFVKALLADKDDVFDLVTGLVVPDVPVEDTTLSATEDPFFQDSADEEDTELKTMYPELAEILKWTTEDVKSPHYDNAEIETLVSSVIQESEKSDGGIQNPKIEGPKSDPKPVAKYMRRKYVPENVQPNLFDKEDTSIQPEPSKPAAKVQVAKNWKKKEKEDFGPLFDL